jgi:hypothetical protein
MPARMALAILVFLQAILASVTPARARACTMRR